jgi:ribulose-5-phosphate 4-epimerase/fuculose-1-phosphate aldolase
MADLNKKFEDAIWVAKSLFDRGKTAGSSANLSFLHEGHIYITGSGTCFGRLTKDDFSEVTLDRIRISGQKPSKELPLHQMYYEKSLEIQAVIHTHSFYSTLYSCSHREVIDGSIVPDFTPYLKMKVGTIGMVGYAKPGTQELFDYFKGEVDKYDAFLLAHHGAIVGGKTMMDAFYGIEELEESCRIALGMLK